MIKMPSSNRTVLGRYERRFVLYLRDNAATAALAAYLGGLWALTERADERKRAGKRTRAFLTPHLRHYIFEECAQHNFDILAATVLVRNLPLETLGLSFLSKFSASVAALFALILYTIYYSKYVVETPVFRHKRTYFNVSVVEKMRPSSSRMPTFWAFNRHAQTVMLFMLGHIEGGGHP